jgi:hypothetical protein
MMAHRREKPGVTVEVTIGQLGGIVLLAALVLLLALGSGGRADRVQVGESAVVSWGRSRSFYLTDSLHDAKGAPAACDAGYHMASLWEIRDVSRLVYDTARGYAAADAGDGPPSAVPGWIRTGYWESTGTIGPGIGNCQRWTTDNHTMYGSVVRLDQVWDASPTAISPWVAGSPSCDTAKMHVWCVGSASEIYLPLVTKAY